MKTIRILDKSGDTAITFDEADAEATAKAKAVFDDWMKKGAAFLTKRQDGRADEKITDFGQIEDGTETILVAPIVAG